MNFFKQIFKIGALGGLLVVSKGHTQVVVSKGHETVPHPPKIIGMKRHTNTMTNNFSISSCAGHSHIKITEHSYPSSSDSPFYLSFSEQGWVPCSEKTGHFSYRFLNDTNEIKHLYVWAINEQRLVSDPHVSRPHHIAMTLDTKKPAIHFLSATENIDYPGEVLISWDDNEEVNYEQEPYEYYPQIQSIFLYYSFDLGISWEPFNQRVPRRGSISFPYAEYDQERIMFKIKGVDKAGNVGIDTILFSREDKERKSNDHINNASREATSSWLGLSYPSENASKANKEK